MLAIPDCFFIRNLKIKGGQINVWHQVMLDGKQAAQKLDSLVQAETMATLCYS